jgi:hypothetical protein
LSDQISKTELDENAELLNTIEKEITDEHDFKPTTNLSEDEERRFYILKEFLETEKQYRTYLHKY